MIYWDHNATTHLRPEVAALLAHRYQEAVQVIGNPASVHALGRRARSQLWAARGKIAEQLGCQAKEVCFVGSGTEANALALKGAFLARAHPAQNRLVASAIEHPSVLYALEQLKAQGAEVVLVPPGQDGMVPAAAFAAALEDERTLLCSLMWVNNETGVVQPVAEVSRLCQERGVLFHTDAVQAAGKVQVSLRDVPADLLAFSGHKVGAPAGSAALVIGANVELDALVAGHQEGGRRGGTPDVASFEALALAFSLSQRELRESGPAIRARRDAFEAQLKSRIPTVRINGDEAPRVDNTSNVTFPGADGEALLIALDLEAISVSNGAACAAGSLKPSHVLLAMGLSEADARSSLRFSLGSRTTDDEVSKVLDALTRAHASP